MANSGNIDTPLDEANPSRFMIGVWALCALVLLLDGYDLTVISFIAPELVKEFGFDKSALGPLFAASLVGFALGGPLGGLIGDRYGRKFTIVASCFIFGLATLAMLLSTTVAQMAACRFIVGVGLGGALPTATAMTAEFTPKRLRNRVLALVSTAVPLGAIIPGVITAALVPTYGWRVLAVAGGVLPVLLAIVLIWAMPESFKYLALRPERSARLAALLKRLDPDLQWVPGSGGSAEQTARSASLTRLFGDGLAGITLLMWVLFFMNAMALYLVISWLPLVLQSLGMSIQQAGQFSAMFAAGGLIGGLAIAALISWVGIALLPAMFIIAVPFLLMFAAFDLSHAAIVLCVLVPGISVGALQVGCSTITGLLYPTAVRATGVGWGLGMGRIGAILGPLVGAAVFTMQLPPQQMFAFAAAPMIAGAIGAVILAVLCYRRFGSLQVDETAVKNETVPVGDSNPAEQVS
ncbi:MFS transporter [Chelativorans alearense]|uniref:MFS transporter n=1 Tax=Chelativorans alearense TaxID=2681495 RepID=UPI0013D5EB26|nr:MFS transporter [Chelativorans alearense]